MVQPSWEWVLMGVVSTALNQGKWASYNGVALEKQRKNSLIFMHRLTCRRAFVLLRWCFHCFRYKWNSKNLSLLLVTPKRVIAVTQYIEPYIWKKNSCQTTLIKLVEDWKRSLHDQKVLGVLTIDSSKAFDSLHPLLLLAKPSAYGFSDEDIGLLRSYFSEGTNSVRIGTETSSEWK